MEKQIDWEQRRYEIASSMAAKAMEMLYAKDSNLYENLKQSAKLQGQIAVGEEWATVILELTEHLINALKIAEEFDTPPNKKKQ